MTKDGGGGNIKFSASCLFISSLCFLIEFKLKLVPVLIRCLITPKTLFEKRNVSTATGVSFRAFKRTDFELSNFGES